MTEIRESTAIEGVYIAELQSHGDQRGRFTEIYRKEWFPQRSWDALQWSRSELLALRDGIDARRLA
jgi:dTDP-4-dehydrorhamnose 3,5-epimerase